MSFWFLVQIVVNLILLAGFASLWMKLNRPPKDDPRMSKGLQLLQSKIAVLEDLSDRTETQVQQLTALLESKVKEVQNKIVSSDKQIAKIDQAMAKSKEVADIFQDRVPHQEIMERQTTRKFVKAARMAHQGSTIEEIVKETGVSTAEAEFISKVNKDQLQFCEQSLPAWVEDGTEFVKNEDADSVTEAAFIPPTQRGIPRDLSSVFEVPQPDQAALKKLGDAFKAACQETEKLEEGREKQEGFFDLTQMMKSSETGKSAVASNTATPSTAIGSSQQEKTKNLGVRPVEFRKIELVKDLQ